MSRCKTHLGIPWINLFNSFNELSQKVDFPIKLFIRQFVVCVPLHDAVQVGKVLFDREQDVVGGSKAGGKLVQECLVCQDVTRAGPEQKVVALVAMRVDFRCGVAAGNILELLRSKQTPTAHCTNHFLHVLHCQSDSKFSASIGSTLAEASLHSLHLNALISEPSSVGSLHLLQPQLKYQQSMMSLFRLR
jgi:hypothetical protein